MHFRLSSDFCCALLGFLLCTSELYVIFAVHFLFFAVHFGIYVIFAVHENVKEVTAALIALIALKCTRKLADEEQTNNSDYGPETG